MKFLLALRYLWRRRLLTLLGLVAAVTVAVLAGRQTSKPQWTASTLMLVDAHNSQIGNANVDPTFLSARASIFAGMMTQPNVVSLIGRAAHIPPAEISSIGPSNGMGAQSIVSPATARSSERYTLQYNVPSSIQPIVQVSASAGSRDAAIALANGAPAGLAAYLAQLEANGKVPLHARADVRELGSATATQSGSGSKLMSLALGLVVFLLWCMVILLAPRFAQAWRRSANLDYMDGGAALERLPESPTPQLNGGGTATIGLAQLFLNSHDNHGGGAEEQDFARALAAAGDGSDGTDSPAN